MHHPSARNRNLLAALVLILIAIAALWTLRPGQVEMPALPSGTTQQDIEIAAPTERDELVEPAERSNAERSVEVEAATSTESLAISISEAGVLAGHVTFTDGSVPPPILLNVQLWTEPGEKRPVEPASGCRHEAYATTDENGRFRVEGVCPGKYRSHVVKPEWISANGLFEAPTSDAHFVLQGYLMIARAIDANRNPIADVHMLVEIRHDPDGSGRNPLTYAVSKMTDAEGEAWIAMSGSGEATIRVRGLGPEAPSDLVSLRMTPGIVRRDIYVPIAPSRADLRVRFTACGDDSFRVRKFRIHMTPTGSTGQKQGPELNLAADSGTEDAVFHSLPAGRYLVKVKDSVMGAEPADFFEGPDAQWAIELEDGHETLLSKCLRVGGHLRVLVQDACPTPHESPVSARFELLGKTEDRVRELGFREPLPDGLQTDSALPIDIERYCDRVFEPGEHTLRVRSKGHADQIVRVTVKAGEATALVVRLDPAE